MAAVPLWVARLFAQAIYVGGALFFVGGALDQYAAGHAITPVIYVLAGCACASALWLSRTGARTPPFYEERLDRDREDRN